MYWQHNRPARATILLPFVFASRMHKNRVKEPIGWNDKIFKWCLDEAKSSQLKESDFWGGFAIDEMKIQVNSP